MTNNLMLLRFSITFDRSKSSIILYFCMENSQIFYERQGASFHISMTFAYNLDKKVPGIYSENSKYEIKSILSSNQLLRCYQILYTFFDKD